MPSPHDNNWQSDLPPSEIQGQPQQQENPYKKMIMASVSLALASAFVGVVAWEKVIGPTWDYFQPPLRNMATEIGSDAAELQQASDKNCRGINFNRRACKSVWANVTIPSLDQTANASSHVNVPGQ